jgi:hypothetical protein
MEFLDALIGYGLNTVLVTLIPTAIAGTVVKIQKGRRAYPKGTEGEKELTRDSNAWLLVLNALFLLWSLGSWPGPLEFACRVGFVGFLVYIYYNRPLRLIAVPEVAIASLRWVNEIVDEGLQRIPGYSGLRQRSQSTRGAMEAGHLRFSGKEIPALKKEQQLLLTQTQFICHSCGATREFTDLGDVLRDGRNRLFYFCDRKPCRMEARDLHSKELISWRRKTGDFV